MPQMKGQIKPMMKASKVGRTNTGQYLLIAFCMIHSSCALGKKGQGRACCCPPLPV